MTLDDRLRELTDDIGRGKDDYPWVRECPEDYDADPYDVPLASDAMAERDEHGEVKGVMF